MSNQFKFAQLSARGVQDAAPWQCSAGQKNHYPAQDPLLLLKPCLIILKQAHFFFYPHLNFSQVILFSVQIPLFCTAQGWQALQSEYNIWCVGQDVGIGGLCHLPALLCVGKGQKTGRNFIQTSWNSHSHTNTRSCSKRLLLCEKQIDFKVTSREWLNLFIASWPPTFSLHTVGFFVWGFFGSCAEQEGKASSFTSPSYVHQHPGWCSRLRKKKTRCKWNLSMAGNYISAIMLLATI